jgi:DNA transformation protein
MPLKKIRKTPKPVKQTRQSAKQTQKGVKQTRKAVKQTRKAAKRPAREAPGEFGRRLHVSNGFREFAIDQLSHACEVAPRGMFGGIGLYSGDLFFGLLAGDVLYLKADDATRQRFEQVRAKPFMPYPDRASTHYFEVPVTVLEDADELRHWVIDALAAASRSRKPNRKPAATRSASRSTR